MSSLEGQTLTFTYFYLFLLTPIAFFSLDKHVARFGFKVRLPEWNAIEGTFKLRLSLAVYPKCFNTFGKLKKNYLAAMINFRVRNPKKGLSMVGLGQLLRELN